MFPGHERSRLLLGDLATKANRSKDQKLFHIENDRHRAMPSSLELMISAEQSNVSVNSPISKQRQDAKEVSPQTRGNLEDRWPNGAPPAGPRKYLQRTATNPESRRSSAGENGYGPTLYGRSLTWKSQRNPLSPEYRTETRSLTTPQKLDKVIEDSVAAVRCAKDLEKHRSRIHDSSQPFYSNRGMTVVATSDTTPARGVMGQIDGSHDMQLHGDVEPAGHSPPKCVSTYSKTSVPRPKSHSLLTANESFSRSSTELSNFTLKNSVNKAEGLATSPPASPQHRDIACVRKRVQRCSSEAASVTSTASSITGKSSSSSVSSALRLSICHICKKPPFKEKLKGCFVCSRHYHKGCAKPKDRSVPWEILWLNMTLNICRITEDTWTCRRCLNKLVKPSEPALILSSKLFVSSDSERMEQVDKIPGPALSHTSTRKSSMRKVTTISDPLIATHSHPENSEPNEKIDVSGKTRNASTDVDDPLLLRDRPLKVDAYNVISSELRRMLEIEDTNDGDSGALVTSVKGSSAVLPVLFHGWQAKIPENMVGGKSVNTLIDSTPSSPTAAPSYAEGVISEPCNSALTPASRSNLRCTRNTNEHPPVFDHGVEGFEEQTVKSYSSISKESLSPKPSSADNGPATYLRSGDSTSHDRMESNTSSAQPIIVPSGSRKKTQKTGVTYTSVELNIPETPSAAGPHATHSGGNIAYREGASPQSGTSLPKPAHVPANDSLQLAKKLCIRCRRPILGSTTMCRNCQQADGVEMCCRSEEHRGNGISCAMESPTPTMALSDLNPCLSCSSNECKCAIQSQSEKYAWGRLDSRNAATVGFSFQIGKSNHTDEIATPRLQDDGNPVSTSPSIPETPEFVTKRPTGSSRAAHDDKTTLQQEEAQNI